MRARQAARYLALAAFALLAALWLAYPEAGERRMCEWSGGVWASNGASCITRSCQATHTCGARYCPACQCPNIAPGMAVADVYLHLGEPAQVNGNQLIWPRGASESGHVVATVSDERLVSIDCAAAKPP